MYGCAGVCVPDPGIEGGLEGGRDGGRDCGAEGGIEFTQEGGIE